MHTRARSSSRIPISSAASSSSASPSCADLFNRRVAATRIRAFRRALEDAVAERREEAVHTTGLFCDSLRDVYDLNFLRADAAAPVDALVAEADALMPGFFHRKIVVDRGGDEVESAFRQRGWTPSEHLVMAHAREPDRRVDTAGLREVSFDALEPLRTEAARAEPWGNLELAVQLNAAKRRMLAAIPTRFYAAFAGDEIAAWCEVRSDGRTAQIEDVNTLTRFRGAGLGRAVVQHAVDQTAAGHDLVFLEALSDDWPHGLYSKLGFDIVDRRQLFLLAPTPLVRLRLRTPRLELRLGTVAELRELASVVEAGVHAPNEMPFEVAWTDAAGSPSFVDDFVEHHRSTQEAWRPDDWRLNLIVFHDGRPVGDQSVRATGFEANRRVATGSWLGQRWQGLGFGTEMRSAALALAFDGLGAELAMSGAIGANDASLGVSRKLGYREVGAHTVAPRGVPVDHTDLELRREEFHPPVPVEIAGLEPLLPLFGLT